MSGVNWSKIKIPSFGMSDSMVKFKNGTFKKPSDNEEWPGDEQVTNLQVSITPGKKGKKKR